LNPHLLVIALGFNRPDSLKRLLRSLGEVGPVACRADLLVSLDGDGDPACEQVAKSAEWSHGGCTVVVQPERLGLKRHVEAATGRVRDYDGVVVLEDDLSVSPWMLHYCREALLRYGNDEQIAQISLYAPRINEFSGLPFEPVPSEEDVWFARVPSSWGQLYSKTQWETYLREKDDDLSPTGVHMPPQAYTWKHSWKKYLYHYIARSGKWVVYPRVSLTTNHGEAGQNYRFGCRDLEVMLERVKRSYRFADPSTSTARYDEWLEPLPEDLGLQDVDPVRVEVDLNAVKPLQAIERPYLLSTRECLNPLQQYPCYARPLEMNPRLNLDYADGAAISLGRREDFKELSEVARELSAQVARGTYRHIHKTGEAFGQRSVESTRPYRLGRSLLWPVRVLRNLLKNP
jgi:hypothetical protein